MELLTGKNILITGASSGIGQAILQDAIDNGASLLVACGRDPSKLNILCNKIFSMNTNAIVFPWAGDFLDKNSLQNFFNFLTEKDFVFDGIIFSAGADKTLPFKITTDDIFLNLFRINSLLPIEILRMLWKNNRINDSASIIFISSVMGFVGQPGKTAYCSTKAALIGAVKALALELAYRKIRVNVIAPGIVETPMTDNLFKILTADNLLKLKAMHPLGFGTAEDIAYMATFLLSKKSRWITGSTITIDGGYTAH
jgi:NAD(P)-dependent dehydrogenase (short-subunit alcohol dehydrogenase family)